MAKILIFESVENKTRRGNLLFEPYTCNRVINRRLERGECTVEIARMNVYYSSLSLKINNKSLSPKFKKKKKTLTSGNFGNILIINIVDEFILKFFSIIFFNETNIYIYFDMRYREIKFIFYKFLFFYSYRIVFDFSHQTLEEKSTGGDFSLARFVTETRLAALSRVYLYDTPLFSATNENQRH